MTSRLNDARILMYSHDSFGLGHLRRCRTIAHALVEDYRGLNVLIISGATIAGAFDYRARVDFVKIPSVIKLRNGEYTSMDRHIDLQETLKMRRSIIYHTAESFQPDIFIVDKEPMGLRGEVEETLAYLKGQGTKLVIGLRDVMDAPQLLEAEWKRNNVMTKIGQFYDDVWIYGPPDFHDPLTGLDVPHTVRDKMDFVGFLQRSKTQAETVAHRPEGDYLLVTTGGGGDGSELIDDVINAYRHDSELTHKALVVLGPYMPADQRQRFTSSVADIPHIEIIELDNRMEDLVAGAQAVQVLQALAHAGGDARPHGMKGDADAGGGEGDHDRGLYLALACRALRMASPIWVVEALAGAVSLAMSLVRSPSASTAEMAASSLSAHSPRPSE